MFRSQWFPAEDAKRALDGPSLCRRKNDFHLAPIASGNDGRITLLKKDLEAEIAEHYDSGLMDYYYAADWLPSVSLRRFSEDQRTEAIRERTAGWTSLLAGERDRWASMQRLLDPYRGANNAYLAVSECAAVSAKWSTEGSRYKYPLACSPKASWAPEQR